MTTSASTTSWPEASNTSAGYAPTPRPRTDTDPPAWPKERRRLMLHTSSAGTTLRCRTRRQPASQSYVEAVADRHRSSRLSLSLHCLPRFTSLPCWQHLFHWDFDGSAATAPELSMATTRARHGQHTLRNRRQATASIGSVQTHPFAIFACPPQADFH